MQPVHKETYRYPHIYYCNQWLEGSFSIGLGTNLIITVIDAALQQDSNPGLQDIIDIYLCHQPMMIIKKKINIA